MEELPTTEQGAHRDAAPQDTMGHVMYMLPVSWLYLQV